MMSSRVSVSTPGDDICNIASAVDVMAQMQPFRPAIFYPSGRDVNGRVAYTHYTYRQLVEASDTIAAGMAAYGVTRGMRAVLMVTPSLEFFALTFALFRAGIVPVMIDPGIDRASLKQCLDEAEPVAFIGVPRAHLGRVLLGWGKRTIRLNVTVGRGGPWGGVTLAWIREIGRRMGLFTTADTRADELAAVIFTSGSTGIPKGVMYTHGNFASQIPMLRDTYNIQPGELSLQTFPLFALFDPGLGTATVVPDMDAAHPARVDPRKIIEPLEDFGITTMFGSPAVLDKLGRYGEEHRIRLPMLRRVISAGAPVPAEVLERFARMLPDEAEIFTPYGATEALPVASISSREVLGETRRRTDEGGGVCIGHPLKGAEVQVIRISDDPIPAWDASLALPVGEVGEIAVKGPMVTRSYFNRPRQTELAKIADPSGGFYHRMGDLACFDEAGRLWFCGRKSHRVETADGRLFTEPVEGVFNTHPDVRRSALVGVRIRGEIEPLVCIELEKNRPARSQEILREELLALGAKRPHTARISRFLFHPAFPVDIRHNSKIFRERLAAWAQKELGE